LILKINYFNIFLNTLSNNHEKKKKKKRRRDGEIFVALIMDKGKKWTRITCRSNHVKKKLVKQIPMIKPRKRILRDDPDR
jgi:hypothetical protein